MAVKPVLALVLWFAAACPISALAQPSAANFAATTLDLTASGEVRVQPDLAVLNLGVQADGADAAQAFAQARRRMASLFTALHGQGVADIDIQTAELNLQAQYDNSGKGAPVLTGYRASDTLSVRLHDLGRVGGVIDALVAAGANEVDGVSFELSNPKAAQDEARRLAVKALQAKADLYAEATGYRIRRLVSLSEGGGGYPGPEARVFAMRRPEAKTVVAPGQQTVTATVDATFELTR